MKILAKVKNDHIVIKVPVSELSMAVRHATEGWSEHGEFSLKDPVAFAKSLVSDLNSDPDEVSENRGGPGHVEEFVYDAIARVVPHASTSVIHFPELDEFEEEEMRQHGLTPREQEEEEDDL